MPRTRIKMCGLMSPEDARAAVRAGADAVGVILAPGHRRSVTPQEAAEVFESVPQEVHRVGVFVDPSFEDVVRATGHSGLSEVQLHGNETPAFCKALKRGLGVRVVKTIPVGVAPDPSRVDAYGGSCDAVLLDTLVDGTPGGTGTTFDHALAEGVHAGAAALYVAGGLTAENVGAAIRTLAPDGVDVSSGIEAAVGRKDERRMRAFVEAVRAAETRKGSAG